MWFPSINFFGKKSEPIKLNPVPTMRPTAKQPAAPGSGIWVGNVIGDKNPELKHFITVNAVEGKEKEALQEFLDYCFLETCKLLNRRP